MAGDIAHLLIAYLRRQELMLTTAESCTAGAIISALSQVEGCGAVVECGYVVYSIGSKKRLLQVRQETLDRCNVTSEAVAWEMAEGALNDSEANVAIATTGVAGPDPTDGVPPGTVCFAWGFRVDGCTQIFTATQHFNGPRTAVQLQAARFAMEALPRYHQQLRNHLTTG